MGDSLRMLGAGSRQTSEHAAWFLMYATGFERASQTKMAILARSPEAIVNMHAAC